MATKFEVNIKIDAICADAQVCVCVCVVHAMMVAGSSDHGHDPRTLTRTPRTLIGVDDPLLCRPNWIPRRISRVSATGWQVGVKNSRVIGYALPVVVQNGVPGQNVARHSAGP